jgi:hypothetical protein
MVETFLDNQVRVNLEEYKALKSEIDSNVAHQNSLFNWTLVFFVGVSSLMFGYPTALKTLVDMGIQWILLLIPFIFIAIAFDYQLQYFNITNVARYLNLNLRPRLCSLLRVSEEQLLAWEDYLDEARRRSGIIERISMNARYVLILVMALLWVLFFILITRVHFKICWGTPDLILLTIEALAMAVILYSNVLVVKRFRQIARRVPSEGESSLKTSLLTLKEALRQSNGGEH